MEISIREYQESDYESCRELWVELTQYHRDIYQTEDIGGSDPGRGFDDYLENKNRQGPWVAVPQEKIVGMTGLLVSGIEAEIEPVVVSASYRGKGVGQKLLRHAIGEAKNRGIKFLSIKPVARNTRAISLFNSLGFGTIGQIELFQELQETTERHWKSGIRIHENKFKY